MTPPDAMQRIDAVLSHVWMVRTFLKHSEEAEEDEDLSGIYRGLYDYMLALGEPARSGDAQQYLKTARKKYAKLRRTMERFCQLQPEISTHTNFQMAAISLRTSVEEIGDVLNAVRHTD